jgi:2-keto-3-deoxy-L-rhamnonate aldolase RhmA
METSAAEEHDLLGKTVKTKLKQGGVAIGTIVEEFKTPMIPNIIANAGIDWMFLETEHIYYDSGFFNPLCVIANSVNLPLVIKVDEVTRSAISKPLDAGVSGVRLPRTETLAQVKKLVEWTKYPPVGDRAVFLGGNADFQDRDLVEYMEEANQSTLIFAHIETAKGVENIDEILSDKDVDVAIVGLYDLSISLGIPGEFKHPKMEEVTEKIIEASKRHGVASGTYASSIEDAEYWIKRGMQCMECYTDVSLYGTALRTLTQRLKMHRTDS